MQTVGYRFRPANAKLRKLQPVAREFGYDGTIVSADNPSGNYSCPWAKDCKSSAMPFDKHGKVVPISRRHDLDDQGEPLVVRWGIVDGPQSQFRCYAASLEVAYPALREILHGNLEALKAWRRMDHEDGMLVLLSEALDEAGAYDNRSVVRIHSHGEFWSTDYLDTWLRLAAATPSNLYYTYTKAVAWMHARAERGDVPENFKVTYSRGGTQDHLIDQYGLKEAVVVQHAEEAEALGLEVDWDDSHAAFGDTSFALALHGTQPKGVGKSYRSSLTLQRI
jgi:hypothetical protein